MTNSATSTRLESTSSARRDTGDSSKLIKRKTTMLHVYLAALALSVMFLGNGCLANPYQRGGKSRKSRVSGRKLSSAYRCLKESNDVGCEIFQCLAGIDSCELDGLQVLCQKLSRTAGDFNKLGKIFIKKSLRCMTMTIKAEFPSHGRKCPDLEKFVLRVQAECYTNNSLCKTARTNAGTFMEVVAVEDVLSKRASLQLFQLIMGCGEETAMQYRNLITSTIGQSFLSTLHYLQDGAPFPILETLNSLAKWTG